MTRIRESSILSYGNYNLISNLGARQEVDVPLKGEKGIWLESIAAPATVFDDESFKSPLYIIIGEGKR